MTHFHQTPEMSWVASEHMSGKERETDPWDEREATCSHRQLGDLPKRPLSFPSPTRVETGLGADVLKLSDLKSKPNERENLDRHEKQD